MIAANNGYLLPPNALCRLATGGSFAVRRLYTNDESLGLGGKRDTALDRRRAYGTALSHKTLVVKYRGDLHNPARGLACGEIGH
jgi:hypothetical protein